MDCGAHPGRLAALALACGLSLASPAGADRSEDAARAREGVREGRFVTAQSLLDWLESRYLGRVIEVELEEDDDDEAASYEIEWLTPQRHVIEFEFDARTGQLLEVEGHGLEEAKRP